MTSSHHSRDQERNSSKGKEGDTPGVTADDPLVHEEKFKFDTGEARRRTIVLLEDWMHDGRLEQVRSRTKKVTAGALCVFVVSAVLSGSASGITETIATMWLWISGAVFVIVGSVAFLLYGIENPTDYVLKNGGLALVGMFVLAVGGTHHTRHPIVRIAWRYLITGPLAHHSQLDSTGEVGLPSDMQEASSSRPQAEPKSTETIQQYGRLVGGIFAALIVLHQVWVTRRGGNTVLSPVLDSGIEIPNWGTNLSPVAAGGVLIAVLIFGTLVGILLAASRQ